LPELVGLADILHVQGLEDEEDLITSVQEHFGLGRLAVSTRQRFKAAITSVRDRPKAGALVRLRPLLLARRRAFRQKGH
jgi:hypothetical protein